MHKAQEYIRAQYIVGTPSSVIVQNTALTALHASNILAELSNDSISYFYSAFISFADAIRGIQSGYSSWPTVKLYYSTFYALRSILASQRFCLFYVGTRPFSLLVRAAECPKKEDGQTHKVVMEMFRQYLPQHTLLSQDIDLVSPMDWLMEKREEANYKNAKFNEPSSPSHLEKIFENGVRRSLIAYANDSLHTFTFDKEHSIVAFPLKSLVEACQMLRSQNQYYITRQELSYLTGLIRDREGLIPSFSQLFC